MIMSESFKGYHINHLLSKRSCDLFMAKTNTQRWELCGSIFWNMQNQIREHIS